MVRGREDSTASPKDLTCWLFYPNDMTPSKRSRRRSRRRKPWCPGFGAGSRIYITGTRMGRLPLLAKNSTRRRSGSTLKRSTRATSPSSARRASAKLPFVRASSTARPSWTRKGLESGRPPASDRQRAGATLQTDGKLRVGVSRHGRPASRFPLPVLQPWTGQALWRARTFFAASDLLRHLEPLPVLPAGTSDSPRRRPCSCKSPRRNAKSGPAGTRYSPGAPAR